MSEEEKKPLTKIEWMQKELAADEYFPSELGINKVLADQPTSYTDDLLDYIKELSNEWDASH